MNWKSWPYWVKGGILGGSVGLVFALGLWTCTGKSYSGYSGFGGLICLPWALPVVALIYLTGGAWGFPSSISALNSPFFLNVAIWAIVGSLLGYLYGKFKNRKQLST